MGETAQDMKPTIMAHCISHFPDEQTSLDVARSLAAAGARYLEVQVPFSDPFADGALIQGACAEALEEPDAFSVAKGFAMLERLVQSVKENPTPVAVFLMCYGNTPVAYGLDAFVKEAQRVGVGGLIIPDIPFDSDVGVQIQAACKAAGLHYIPVAVVTSGRERLQVLVQSLKPQYLYMSLRTGITGQKTSIDGELVDFLTDAVFASTRLLGGFGIQNAEQVQALSPYVHACVVGSAFVKAIINARTHGADIPQAVRAAYEALV